MISAFGVEHLSKRFDPRPSSAEQAEKRGDVSRNAAFAATGAGVANMAIDMKRRDKANPGWIFNAMSADMAKQPRPAYKTPRGSKAAAVVGTGLGGTVIGGIGYNRYNRYKQKRLKDD